MKICNCGSMVNQEISHCPDCGGSLKDMTEEEIKKVFGKMTQENKQERNCERCGDPCQMGSPCSVICPKNNFDHWKPYKELNPKQSKEVESGYEEKREVWYKHEYEMHEKNESEKLHFMLKHFNEIEQLALKEGERRAIKKVEKMVESKKVEKFEYPNEGGCTTCRDFISKEDLLSELSKLKEGRK